ncbi:nitroreductase family protein [Sebaldella sp. S0638]|uniref:nitroreductase family protein n=1 Tax=Sebaldella sp. S0638 TaxID=2957809 RepID=UPI00209D0D5F|nr:nitroreductase family protein [Sebaldella sp. S0638]MCP1224334.1 nitroreductase family protein [Sebaldella sp. S0638]
MSMNSKSIADAIKERRSIRNLKKPENLTKEKIEEILKVALYTPSAFGMQSARMIVVTGDENKKLWDIAKAEVKKTLPEGQDFKPTEDKLNGFASGFGTVMFFEEDTTTKNMQDNFSLYADNFPVWAEQANGMLQYAVWMLLHTEGLAASLQHYNPLIDASVKQEWNVPSTWRLRAQMPFGLADETPGDRKFLDFSEVVKLY